MNNINNKKPNIAQLNLGIHTGMVSSAKFELWQYLDFLKKAIEYEGKITLTFNVIAESDYLKTNGSSSPVSPNEEKKKEGFRYYLDSKELSDGQVEGLKKQLFETNKLSVYDQNKDFHWKQSIEVIDRDPETESIVLKREIEENRLYLRPNTYQLKMQIKALQNLRDSPLTGHRKLYEIFGNQDYSFQESFEPEFLENEDWGILKNADIEGTTEQREFVEKALATPDFALLEGPPGSGKTTAIIELILQYVKKGKRVLLCSSTHVAIDNVISRVVGKDKAVCKDRILPVRIASNEGDISEESVRPYWLKTLASKYKKKLKSELKNKRKLPSQDYLYDALNNRENTYLDRIILDSANLVSGTMIGILQHPDFKGKAFSQPFDLMIVDEASKVTFQEFIVPALYARKWVLVGDVQQLSPYVEGSYVSLSLDALLPNIEEKNSLVDLSELKRRLRKKIKYSPARVLYSESITASNLVEFREKGLVTYEFSKKFRATQEEILALNSADIILVNHYLKSPEILEKHLYVAVEYIGSWTPSDRMIRRQDYFHGKHRYQFHNNQSWSELLASKLDQYYSFRRARGNFSDVEEEMNDLVPETIKDEVDKIKRIAFPSILEILQRGCDPFPGQERTKVFTHGMPESAKRSHFVSLSFQHRMHESIAAISKEFFYQDNNNLESSKIVENRPWAYLPTEARVTWIPNNYFSRTKKIINQVECDDILKEVMKIQKFAASQNDLASPLEVAVLSFYRNQEGLLKNKISSLFNAHPRSRHFKSPNLVLKVCTVDRFQGQEADIVLLSFTKFSPNAHYNSPNRLNVALTRARHKLLLFGNKGWFQRRAKLDALKALSENYEERFNEERKNIKRKKR